MGHLCTCVTIVCCLRFLGVSQGQGDALLLFWLAGIGLTLYYIVLLIVCTNNDTIESKISDIKGLVYLETVCCVYVGLS